jgi:WD40 repeat protein
VTTGADGLARTWDIREACLQRYGSTIGDRSEYTLKVHGKDITQYKMATAPSTSSARSTNASAVAARAPLSTVDIDTSDDDVMDFETGAEQPSVPPCAPVLAPDSSAFDFNAEPAPPLSPADAILPPSPAPPFLPAPGAAEVPPPIPVPPLPPAAGGAAMGDAEDSEAALGRFVANALLDNGVKLVTKFQHGATVEERMGGPGTRTRRSAVKVICVARCPVGGHFATGSDDGICRVWLDEDDSLVDQVDSLQERKPPLLSTHRSSHQRKCLVRVFVHSTFYSRIAADQSLQFIS